VQLSCINLRYPASAGSPSNTIAASAAEPLRAVAERTSQRLALGSTTIKA